MLDFFNKANAQYIETLYQQFREDPDSVDIKWAAFFSGLEAAGHSPTDMVQSAGNQSEKAFRFSEGVKDLVNSYRELGHFVADINPIANEPRTLKLLELSELGFSEKDLEQKVTTGSFLGPSDGTLRGLIEALKTTYCGTMGVEYRGIADKDQRLWLRERIEPKLNRPDFSADQKKNIYKQVVAAEAIEQFIHKKFVGQKRFSLEGGESVIPAMNMIVEHGAELGLEEIMVGMAHRGRLNVLANVIEKPLEIILSEFESSAQTQEKEGEGDVKYHLGFSSDRQTATGKTIHCSACPNPSHLEIVDPVVEGKVRAKQFYLNDTEHTRVMPLLVHGEAAFCGQGVVPETLNLSQLAGYRTGGTIHLIVNNQIGFTAEAKETRFTPYPTDIAKAISVPIFHVNADDPEAVVWAAKLATEYRQQFKTDVMIDLWCYRRYGHNEGDDPSFTQPLMYKTINAHPTITEVYAKRLIAEGVLTEQEAEQVKTDAMATLESALNRARENRPSQRVQKFGGVWAGITSPGENWNANTAVSLDTISQVSNAITKTPDDFTPYRKAQKILDNRKAMAEGSRPADWATAEAWALGSMLIDGVSIRLTGQDVRRGTFTHRHAVLTDPNNGEKFTPLSQLCSGRTDLTILNTMLSELAVVGFEYGYSTADPRNLVIWEAQFGDFINMAQPIVDLFIASSEAKWQRMSGLVMLLPHGYEGQGPEHSSARLERFLQLCAGNNIQVVYPTLPSQYFHLLRRQMARPFRKPLIVMSPKSLLRHPKAVSSLDDFTDRKFQPILETLHCDSPDSCNRVVLCSGKVFYVLEQTCEKYDIKDVVLVRVEELYPFPEKEIANLFKKYSSATEFQWVQEEPINMGAWSFVEPRIRKLLPQGAVLRYHGRDEAASPATGWHWLHEREEDEFVESSLRYRETSRRSEIIGG